MYSQPWETVLVTVGITPGLVGGSEGQGLLVWVSELYGEVCSKHLKQSIKKEKEVTIILSVFCFSFSL